MPDYYNSPVIAGYYDPAYASDSTLTDLEFWLDLAQTTGGRILEVACGTGRVLLPIARAGLTIDGLDLSKTLLDILRGKLAAEPEELQRRVTVFQGDMRNFLLNRQYELITVPFRPLQHLMTAEDQLAAFRSFNLHLGPGGRLAFNVFFPDFDLMKVVGVEQPDLTWTDPADPSLTIKRSFVRRHTDTINQFFLGEFIFRTFRGDELLVEERMDFAMSYYTYQHIRVLLEATGFEVEQEYGSFGKEPITVQKEMIFLAKKK